MDRAAERGRAPYLLHARAGCRLLCGRHASRACWRRSVRPTADGRHRSTPGGDRSTWPRICSPACRPTHLPTISSCATPWTPRRLPWAGGRATRATEKRPSMPMHTQRPPASTLRPSRPQRLAGTRHWGNTSSTGTMSSPAVTRTGLRSPSPAQRFNTPVASARGIRALRQAPKVLLRPSRSSAPSPELGSHLGMGLLRPSRPAGMHSLSALLHTRWPCPDECF